MQNTKTEVNGEQHLHEEIQTLRSQLAEREAVLHAIGRGEVDAVMIEGEEGPQVFTLQGADHVYRVLIETINEGAATLDERANTLYCNAQLAAMLEVSLDQLIGTNLSHWVTPEHEATVVHLAQQARQGRCRGEVTVRSRSGKTLPVLLSFSPLLFDSNALVCVVVTDLSEAHHNAQLAAEKRRAQQSDRRKDEFLAMLAHELRNPLAPIRNATELLSRTLPLQPPNGALLDIIRRQLAQMTRLVDDLLDVSRINQGKIVLQQEAHDLRQIVRVALETVQPVLNEHQHALHQSLSAAPLWVSGDAARLIQIVGNILSNAAKYTAPGGHIWLTLEQSGAEAVVRVKDSGSGIASSLLPTIFDLFVQGDQTLDRAQAGLGVGLALVKHLVQAHRGRVEVTSEIGKGTEFTVTLPLTQMPMRSDAQANAPASLVARKRVLIVDDNHDAAHSMAMLLSMNEHEVQTAHNGHSALQLAQHFRPDVIFLDIGLPVMNGYEVAKHLRACQQTRHARLIALTGYGRAEDRHRSAEAGFDHHLVKPVDPQVLQTLLDAGGQH